MRRVSLREANQNFSSCIAEVEAGERLVLVRRGKPVAEMVPYRGKPARNPEHAAAAERLRKFLKTGLDLGGVRADREEIYESGR